MKNTYKNRPRRANYSSDEHGLLQFAKDLDKWCINSEQEINSKLLNIACTRRNEYAKGVTYACKEILGV
jgi:hypothetical protein